MSACRHAGLLLMIAAGAVVLSGGPAWAQASPSSLSLADAIARADAANPAILAARSGRAIDVAGVAVAGERLNPEISVEEARETPHWSVGGSIPLDISGKRGRRIDVANAALAVTDADTERILADVRAEVRRAYFQAVAATRRVEVAQELESVASRASAAAGERFQAGAAPRLEALQAQLTLAEAQNDTARARSEVTAARAELNALLGFADHDAPALSDPLETGVLPTAADAVQQAVAGNADIRVLDRQIDEARARVALARAMRRPDPALSGTFTYGAQPEFTAGWRFGAAIALPIFTTGRPEIAVADATLARATADRAATVARLTGTVSAALARAAAAKQAVDRYQSDILPVEFQVEAMAQESYASGQTGLVALLQALQAGREVRQRAVQAGLDFQLALADLERAMGTRVR